MKAMKSDYAFRPTVRAHSTDSAFGVDRIWDKLRGAVVSEYTPAGFTVVDPDGNLMTPSEIAQMLNELICGMRQIRNWIESENKPGEWTAEIYELAGKLLP
jgi:hypothetical protein